MRADSFSGADFGGLIWPRCLVVCPVDWSGEAESPAVAVHEFQDSGMHPRYGVWSMLGKACACALWV
jgi:hypothetical protein